jgi:hypothetical protein
MTKREEAGIAIVTVWLVYETMAWAVKLQKNYIVTVLLRSDES